MKPIGLVARLGLVLTLCAGASQVAWATQDSRRAVDSLVEEVGQNCRMRMAMRAPMPNRACNDGMAKVVALKDEAVPALGRALRRSVAALEPTVAPQAAAPAFAQPPPGDPAPNAPVMPRKPSFLPQMNRDPFTYASMLARIGTPRAVAEALDLLNDPAIQHAQLGVFETLHYHLNQMTKAGISSEKSGLEARPELLAKWRQYQASRAPGLPVQTAAAPTT